MQQAGQSVCLDEPLSTNPSRARDPFLKWAGGKRWLMYRYRHLFPKKFNLYIEPFLGSAAAFFALQPNRSILSDTNKDLINAYQAIKSSYERVHDLLLEHHASHCVDHYYSVRATKTDDSVIRAANFIYLNRTCWNGLYRVNKFGEFNVPIGTKSKVMLPADDFRAVSKVLSAADLRCSDFEEVVARATEGDFLFVDPPYTVMHDNNGFVKYNENIFKWSDQCRLAACLREATDRGAFVLVTNANHESVRSLYKDFQNINEARRTSVISGSSHGRIRATELVIRNYQ